MSKAKKLLKKLEDYDDDNQSLTSLKLRIVQAGYKSPQVNFHNTQPGYYPIGEKTFNFKSDPDCQTLVREINQITMKFRLLIKFENPAVFVGTLGNFLFEFVYGWGKLDLTLYYKTSALGSNIDDSMIRNIGNMTNGLQSVLNNM